MQQADIKRVRASVHQQCGRKVLIQLDRGRNKVDIQEGVIPAYLPFWLRMSVKKIRLSYYHSAILILLREIFV